MYMSIYQILFDEHGKNKVKDVNRRDRRYATNKLVNQFKNTKYIILGLLFVIIIKVDDHRLF